MPPLTLPLGSDGLVIQAMTGLTGSDTAALVQAGQPLRRPISIRALIDTGSDVTAVAPHVFQQLGLTPLVYATSQTAGGTVRVNLFRVSLTVSGPGSAALLTLPDLLVSELNAPLPVDALIGMDVLRGGLFVLDGPGQQYILGF